MYSFGVHKSMLNSLSKKTNLHAVVANFLHCGLNKGLPDFSWYIIPKPEKYTK
jgi:hypothetical protein